MNIFAHVAQIGVVPVIALDDASDALALADALAEGGLPMAEITFRTPAARAAIETIATHRPGFLIGAGTVVTKDQVRAAHEAGAKFALAPGTDGELITHAADVGLPYAPGVATPSDVQIATRMGCRFLKFFPAALAGGPEMLTNIAAPFAHLGLSFNPTGGIKADTMANWLRQPHVKAVGGTWIATQENIAAGNWTAISRAAADAVARVASTRDNADV